MSRFIYTARLVPLGEPVNIPEENGSPSLITFTATTFETARKSRRQIPICVGHDRNCTVGAVQMLYTRRDWWACDFALDPELPDELEVGQPVSVGIDALKIGSGHPFLTEISIVPQGAVKGAEITSRSEIKPTPQPPSPTPARTTEATNTNHPPPVITAGPINARDAAEDAELRRRLDWLEKHTGRYDLEAALEGMRRELSGPSLDDLARQHGLSRVA